MNKKYSKYSNGHRDRDSKINFNSSKNSKRDFKKRASESAYNQTEDQKLKSRSNSHRKTNRVDDHYEHGLMKKNSSGARWREREFPSPRQKKRRMENGGKSISVEQRLAMDRANSLEKWQNDRKNRSLSNIWRLSREKKFSEKPKKLEFRGKNKNSSGYPEKFTSSEEDFSVNYGNSGKNRDIVLKIREKEEKFFPNRSRGDGTGLRKNYVDGEMGLNIDKNNKNAAKTEKTDRESPAEPMINSPAKLTTKSMAKSKTSNFEQVIIYGRHPVFSVLAKRKEQILALYVSNLNKFNEQLENAKITLAEKITPQLKSNAELDELTGVETHQGYAVLMKPSKPLDILDFLNNECSTVSNLPKLLILDQLTDLHNIGAIIRTAVGFGVNYIIKTRHNSPGGMSIIAKASAGFSELVELVEVTNLSQTIKLLKEKGYFVVGLDSGAGQSVKTIRKLTEGKNLCLVVGSEGAGIRPLVLKNCDMSCRLPMQEGVESLNASVAAAIAIYALWGLE